MRTTQEIIDNQEQYKKQIFAWAKSDFDKCKDVLSHINSQDSFIVHEKNKLEKKIKKLNIANKIKKFFYLEDKNSDTYYVWWDVNLQEAIFFKYE